MKDSIFIWLWTMGTLFLVSVALFIAYSQGQSNVRRHTVVRFGSPAYVGRPYYGTCQTELWFAGERGVACATEDDK